MAFVVVGAGLGLALAAFLRRRPPEGERRGYAVGLAVAAAIYLGFALRDPEPGWLLVEAGGFGAFSLAAWLGYARSPWWISAGWFAHVGWDLLLHGGGHPGFVPEWYTLLCAGLDPVVGLAILPRMGAWRAGRGEGGGGSGSAP